MNKTDVVVVGAGPNGSFSALTAAKLGVEVTVFEEHREIGFPTHCTGHVSIKGLNQLGLNLPKGMVENEFKGAVFHSPRGHEFRVKFARTVTCVLDRGFFDKHLAELAEKTGVTYNLGMKAESFVWHNGFVKGVSFKGKSVKSNIVIDSEGCSSSLLKKAGLKAPDRRMMVTGVKAEVDEVKNVEQDTVEVYLGRKFADGFYAWIAPRRDGSAKVGLATRSGNPKKCLEHFLNHNPEAKEKLKHGKLVNVFYHPIPLGGPIDKTYYNGLLIVGDAASHVKPTTGGGVVTGLNSAKIAGETASHALEEDDFSERSLRLYQRRWRKMMGFDMAIMRQIRLMLNNLSDRELDRIISLCSEMHMDETLQKVMDVDFQGRGLLPIFKSPNTWIVALYFLLHSIT